MTNLADPQDPISANPEATKVNLALEKLGYSQAQITEWWNHSAYKELGGKTPTQAWNAGDYLKVKRLVEGLVSDAFAAQLADNPTIIERLAKAKKH